MGNSWSSQKGKISEEDVAAASGLDAVHGHGRMGPSKSKVLPHLPGPDSAPKLRLTTNGLMLRSFGTISLPRQGKYGEEAMHEPNMAAGRIYGSEPDLLSPCRREQNFPPEFMVRPGKIKISRARKKYKAPTAPNGRQEGSSSPDSNRNNSTDSFDSQIPPRRNRIFKTKAETKKKAHEAPENLHSSGEPHTSLSSSEFQMKIQEAVARLQHLRKLQNNKNHMNVESAPISPVLKENPYHAPKTQSPIEPLYSNYPTYPEPEPQITHHKKSLFTEEIEAVLMERNNKSAAANNNIDVMMNNRGNQWSTPNSKSESPAPPKQPLKKFYFGMNQEEQMEEDFNESDLMKNFGSQLQYAYKLSPSQAPTPTSMSDSFSDTFSDEDNGDIYVKLRATLPRKQLDIPRFSPTNAWRLLANYDSSHRIEEDDILLEERIPPPFSYNLAANLDKSADSGISGDGSPQNHDSTHDSPAAWIPQMDLEETSSDGGLDNSALPLEGLPNVNFPRFYLSLPRDDKLRVYTEYNQVGFSGSKKHAIFSKKSAEQSKGSNGRLNSSPHSLDNNWVLSQSMANSVNVFHSLQPVVEPHSSSTDDGDLEINLVSKPTISYMTSGGHLMYLPDNKRHRITGLNAKKMSKSCENLSHEPFFVVNDKYEVKKKKFNLTAYEKYPITQKNKNEIKGKALGIEALIKVEEENQEKRSSEKADIQEKLRSLSRNGSVTRDFGEHSMSATQVLSEFHEPFRDYRDYKSSRLKSYPFNTG